jgi:hypothetical protein
MITESMALSALPPHGFVRSYCTYAVQQTTAPLAYHLGVALALLAVTTPVEYGVRFATNQRPNLFVMIAGRSGDDQKSTALEIGREILFDAAPQLIGDHPASPEGMVDALGRQGTQLLVYKEAGNLLASTKSGYLEPLKTLLTDLADCSSQQRAKSTKQGEQDVTRIDNPRLSVIGACALPFLERHTEPVDWTGGFLGRWALIYAQRERRVAWPYGNTDGKAPLVKALKMRAEHGKAGWCLGPDKPTMQRWREWFDDVDTRRLPRLVAGVRTRAPVVALKAALLYAWDYGNVHDGEPWYMTADVLEPGIAFAEIYLKSVVSLSANLASTPDARMRRQILSVFHHGVPLSTGEIITATHLKKRTVSEMLESMTEEGVIRRLHVPAGGFAYIRA